ncbi:uncharacterized protein FOMMEDRAFT_156626 [Fomitiporia mediterranea MF3/22]|uniref:uncharacterized protein n=1 Tax=Fomitiporia mediterranea (strain MF3/22) TaxID=694068 RepID=UPI0004407B5D|nr:uncharacterized protein FOMMEDRAFT_156626 [Fomitiporia mediterranea MF3/22]EJD03240.1 hypothetical protein FOMMEDRAFT_156626 [Fomitiporia mediterranea MF3/22]
MQINQSITEGAQAQLVLATMHNAKLQGALNEKEKGKGVENVCIFNGGMPKIFTSQQACEQLRQCRDAKEKEEMQAQARKDEARKKKDINEIIEKEWERVRMHHQAETQNWLARCAQWEEEGLPKVYWDPRPTCLTKQEVRKQVLEAQENETAIKRVYENMESRTRATRDLHGRVIDHDDPEAHHNLAVEYWERFEQSGKREELDKSIAHDRAALKLCPVGHPNRSDLLNNLAICLSTRCQRWGQRADLEEAIELERGALMLRPEGYPDRSASLNNLAISLITRYRYYGTSGDLEEAVEMYRAALELCPEGHPYRFISLISLANSLRTLHAARRRTEDFEEAIELERAALELLPKAHPHRSSYLNSFAFSILTRYMQHGRPEDLEEAIEIFRAALKLRPEGHPNCSSSLNSLANCLMTRYKLHGRTEDLEEAIELHRVAVGLRPGDHLDRSSSLNNSGICLRARYQQHARTEVFEEAIQLHRAALKLRPKGHPDRSSSLNNLASSLTIRYEQHARTEDLEEAIEMHRAALMLCPEGHPDHHSSLINLAYSLSSRYEQHGRSEDLEEAIKLERATLELCPKGHPNHLESLNNLASSLITRYKQHGKSHPDRSLSLDNLANSLRIRYEQHGRTEDLEEAIKLHRDALEFFPKGHPHCSMSLNNLANALSTRYDQHGRTEDLEEAIEMHRVSLKLRIRGHPDRSTSLRNLANSLYARIKKQWRMDGFEECMQLLELAATHTFSGSTERLFAARQWADLARSHNHDTVFTAYKETISILQHALTVSPTLREQHDFLIAKNDYRVLTMEAASYAIEKNELGQAVEILEQGRGLLWSQLRGLRTPLDQLAEMNKELADRFRNVSRQLEHLATSHEALMTRSIRDDSGSLRPDCNPGQKSFDELLKLKKQFLNEQKEIINEIRQVSTFENFLEATPFKILQRAASEGPVIIVNHCKYRCDALIILAHDNQSVVCVPLDDDFYKDSIQLCNEFLEARRCFGAASPNYGEKLREAMKMLWDRVVSKVVDKLTEAGVTKGARIWWCPTSVLSALPFHASGPFEDADGTSKYLLDDYVSSYTPSFGALINARSSSNLNNPKLLVIGDTATLDSRFGMFETLWGTAKQALQYSLTKATWVHFACHGHLDPKPFDCSFKLADHGLTLLDIIQANVPNAEFAFLSACHTAELSHSGAHDEALHLSAAIQFSGFRSVIGTMWELYDEDGPLFARVVYEYMNECEDGELMYKRAATGLRKAALQLRAREGIPIERWVNFVHISA